MCVCVHTATGAVHKYSHEQEPVNAACVFAEECVAPNIMQRVISLNWFSLIIIYYNFL